LRRAILSTVALSIVGSLLISCGGSGSSSGGQLSRIKTRAFVSNSYYGILDIINYTKDLESQTGYVTLSSGLTAVQPQKLVLTPDGKSTVVFDAAANQIVVVDNATEATTGSVPISAKATSIVVSPDSTYAYVATPNLAISGQASGAVQIVDIVGFSLGAPIAIPGASSLAVSPDGTKMLVFSNGSDNADFLDLTTLTATTPTIPVPVAVTDAAGNPAVMSRPVAAVFSSDGASAYVANCGAECGGQSNGAGVSVLDMTKTPPQLIGTQSVPAASTMLLDGSTLYVAGSVPGASGGTLTSLAVSGATLTPSNPIPIGPGYHTKMLKSPDGVLFIGSAGQGGSLSMYNIGTANDVVISNKGYVTGMAAIPRRSVVYVVEGGELDIYDTKTRALQASHCPSVSCFIDIIGKAEDVVVVDQ
jgi:DNA-binding beta-propeller fold protein YncE